jgi:hypothetical protein
MDGLRNETGPLTETRTDFYLIFIQPAKGVYRSNHPCSTQKIRSPAVLLTSLPSIYTVFGAKQHNQFTRC